MSIYLSTNPRGVSEYGFIVLWLDCTCMHYSSIVFVIIVVTHACIIVAFMHCDSVYYSSISLVVVLDLQWHRMLEWILMTRRMDLDV